MDEHSFEALRQRIGDEHLGKRMRAQVDHTLNVMGQGLGSFHYENMPLFIRLVDLSLRLSGLKKWFSPDLWGKMSKKSSMLEG